MASDSFIAVDWGTSRLRLWSLSGEDKVLDKRTSPDGMSSLQPAQYASVLEENLLAMEIDSECPAVVCGMAGAAQGWCEAPYRSNEEDLFSIARHAVRVPNIDRSVHILPGVMQLSPPNVMRGEETQLLGLLHTEPHFHGRVCLPGTHTKWVDMQHGVIQRFTTHMTGELFGLLCTHSVLKHSVERLEGTALMNDSAQAWDQSAFESMIDHAMLNPAAALESLFSLRASTLLLKVSAVTSRSQLSGLLIGLELAATQHFWNQGSVAIIGEPALCDKYTSAFDHVGVTTKQFDADILTLNGLIYARHQIEADDHDT